MRLYTFTNMYLSDIQKGIQTAHLVHELMLGKSDDSMTVEWATNHKTIIVLNGGFSSNLDALMNVLGQTGYEVAEFTESQEALGGALTVVGVVLPEKIYALSQYARTNVATVELVSPKTESTQAVFKAVPTEAMAGNEVLIEQLKTFGEYREIDIVLINELNKYKLA